MPAMKTPLAIRCVRWGFCVVIVAGIVAGIYVSGSPATGASYEYRPMSTTTYELCAPFDLPSEVMEDPTSPPAPFIKTAALPTTSWTHAAGRICYSLRTRLIQTAPSPQKIPDAVPLDPIAPLAPSL